jgi:ubiquinone/menaquinone biosynthesis C-methylase UbiE
MRAKNVTSSKSKRGRVCPHQGAFLLDNWIRRILQPPGKLLQGFIDYGDTVVDLGCGPGFFTIPMARRVGPEGRVVAVDLQPPMLDHVRRKAARCGVADRITCHLARPAQIGLTLAADFILAWYMVHETPAPAAFFRRCDRCSRPTAACSWWSR